MNSRLGTLSFLSGLVAAVLVVLSIALGWPSWVWLLLPTLLAGALLLAISRPRKAEKPPTAYGQGPYVPEPPAAPPYHERVVEGVPIPSAVADFPFLFSGTVCWQPVAGANAASHANPSSLAVTSVLQRVQSATAAEHPSRFASLQYWLEGALGTPIIDGTGLVTAFATRVRLTLRPTDQQRLDELDALYKSLAASERHRQHERELRAYLGEDVLHTPGSAVVWWLARHEDEVERAVDMIGPLACLSAVANGEEVPETLRYLCTPSGAPAEGEPAGGFGHPEPGFDAEWAAGPAERNGRQSASHEHVSALLDELGLAPGSDERAAFVDRLARMSEAAGNKAAADSMRRDFPSEAAESTPPPATAADDVPAHEPPPTGPARSEHLAEPRGEAGHGPDSTTADARDRVRATWWEGAADDVVTDADAPQPPDTSDTTWPGPGT
ncbi:hypothetical protein [Streptomyces youssoufiensis]